MKGLLKKKFVLSGSRFGEGPRIRFEKQVVDRESIL